eukprot:scaffold62339_cov27-Prasinocladus_malaysianus.AAC.2
MWSSSTTLHTSRLVLQSRTHACPTGQSSRGHTLSRRPSIGRRGVSGVARALEREGVEREVSTKYDIKSTVCQLLSHPLPRRTDIFSFICLQ